MASHKRELSSGLWRLVVERPRDPDRPGERQRLVRRFRGTARQAETNGCRVVPRGPISPWCGCLRPGTPAACP